MSNNPFLAATVKTKVNNPFGTPGGSAPAQNPFAPSPKAARNPFGTPAKAEATTPFGTADPFAAPSASANGKPAAVNPFGAPLAVASASHASNSFAVDPFGAPPPTTKARKPVSTSLDPFAATASTKPTSVNKSDPFASTAATSATSNSGNGYYDIESQPNKKPYYNIEVAESVSATKGWICKSCTFENMKPLALVCDICQTARNEAADLNDSTPKDTPVSTKSTSSVPSDTSDTVVDENPAPSKQTLDVAPPPISASDIDVDTSSKSKKDKKKKKDDAAKRQKELEKAEKKKIKQAEAEAAKREKQRLKELKKQKKKKGGAPAGDDADKSKNKLEVPTTNGVDTDSLGNAGTSTDSVVQAAVSPEPVESDAAVAESSGEQITLDPLDDPAMGSAYRNIEPDVDLDSLPTSAKPASIIDKLGLKKGQLDSYIEMWKEVAGDNMDDTHRVSASEAASMLMRSGLSGGNLKIVWDLSDTEEPQGEMNRTEFFHALKYVSLKQAGLDLSPENLHTPSELPIFSADDEEEDDEVTEPVGEYENMPSLALPVANVPDAQLPAYNALWEEAKEDSDIVGAAQAVTFFKSSKLPNSVLRTIWNISDFLEPQGQLTKAEFFVALKLVALAMAGEEPYEDNLSLDVPPPKIGSAKDSADTVAKPDNSDSKSQRQIYMNIDVDDGETEVDDQESEAVEPREVNESKAPTVGQKNNFAASLAAKLAMPQMLPGAAPKKSEPEPQTPVDPNDAFSGVEVRGRLNSDAALSKRSVARGASTKRRPPSKRSLRSPIPTSATALVPTLAPVAELKKGKEPPTVTPKKKPPVVAPKKKPKAANAADLPKIAVRLGLSLQDVDAYAKLWSEADTTDNLLPAGVAVKFLGTSGLPQEQLRTVWSMSDTATPKGQLDKNEFFVACKLIALAQSGAKLDASLDLSARTPLPKIASYAKDGGGGSQSVSAVATKLGLSKSDVDAYSKLWSEADTTNDLFPAGAAVKFLGTSGLPQEQLRTIWSMSDTDTPRGQLDKDEFFLAVKLIALAQSGATLSATMDLAVKTALPKIGSLAIDGDESDGKIASRLGLADQELEAYAKLWADAETVNELFPAGAAVTFLGTSGLPQSQLRTIWTLADTDAPRGQLDKEEFMVACKLVALAQAGKPVKSDATALAVKVPLPKLGTFSDSSA